MKTRIIILIPILSIFLLWSCGSKEKANNESEKTEATEEGHEHENENVVSLNADQMKSIDVRFGQIEQKQLTASLKANGILKVPNQNKATITSLYGGVVENILVQPGNVVRKGETIATIANPQFIDLQEEYISLEAKVKYAELEYNRQKELSGSNAGALKVFQQSEAELRALQARRASLRKQLELLGINTSKLTTDNIAATVAIKSPVSGAVSNVMVNIGSSVDINKPIAEVVDNSQLHLDLYIYEKDLPKVKVGQIIHFTLTNNPGKEYDAEVFGIGNTFEDASKALAIHAIVKGDKIGLIDGMNITALVSLENANVQAVPTDAIVNYQGRDYIFVMTDEHAEEEHHGKEDGEEHDENGHSHNESATKEDHGPATSFERIPVRKGTTDVGYSEITLLKDIPADSKIVVNGAFFILAKMTNSGGHEH